MTKKAPNRRKRTQPCAEQTLAGKTYTHLPGGPDRKESLQVETVGPCTALDPPVVFSSALYSQDIFTGFNFYRNTGAGLVAQLAKLLPTILPSISTGSNLGYSDPASG